MKIIPAIDLFENKCVRLTQGDYSRMTVYSADPISMAKQLASQGADILHVVDLQGAKEGRLVHGELIGHIAKSVSIPVEVGGGIRDRETLKELILMGVSRVILGTAVLTSFPFARKVLQDYPTQVIFGIDARADEVAIKGWTEATPLTVVDTIQRYEAEGLQEVIYTDIHCDGLLNGPNLSMLSNILLQTKVRLIASGGVSTVENIQSLGKLPGRSLEGFIVGKALYEGKLSMQEILEARDASS